ncbi:CNK3/IPCEF1 fusion protein-like isoform X3 [Amphiura filiformis]|uniref:CNK3/IPCEF1 fusion protein-like isoform X3 n=1 Tax=Amphiura filiformis TaxID=82378 RepID=UPI003B2203DF
MSNLQIQRWTAKEVADWLRGLDDCLHPYIQAFLGKGYAGERLMRLTPQDLDDLKITKLGHQEVLLEAVELLKSINYDQPEENLQSVLLHLNTKATNLKNELEKLLPAAEQAAHIQSGSISLPANILLRIADTVTAAKTLISWLDRPPFCKGDDDFQVVRREVLQHALDITQSVQRSIDIRAAVNTIKTCSDELMQLTDSTIKQATDPLVISPTFIDEVTIKKKHQDEELGLFLKTSSIDGVHFITGTKDQSAAGVVGKVHSGDEVLCVNYQTVIAWEHKKVIDLVKEDPMTVTLTLRKRPKNLSTSGQYQRSPQTSFPIYGGRIRPPVQEKTHAQRSRKNSDPTTLRVVMRERDEPTPGPRGAHSDNETTEPLDIDSSFDDSRKIVRRETAGASMMQLRRPPGGSKSNRHSDGRPRSLPEDIAEVITNTAVEDWLRTPITGSPPSSDSQQTPSPKADATTVVKKEDEKKKKSVRINTNNNTETSYDNDRKLSSVSTISSMSQTSQASQMSQFSPSSNSTSVPTYKTVIMSDGQEVNVPRRKKKRRYTVNKHISCVDLGPGECEGLLHLRKKQKRLGTYKWSEMWFVLKEYVLYYYERKEDAKAKGVICLPGYKIQEAPEIKKEFAFKAVHDNTQAVYLHGATQSDKLKWIEKLGLAAILCNASPNRMRQSRIWKEGLVKRAEPEAVEDPSKPMPNIDGFHDHSDSEDEKSVKSEDTSSERGSIPSGEDQPDTPQRPPLLKGQAFELSPTSPPYSFNKHSPVTSPTSRTSLSPPHHNFSKYSNSATSPTANQSPFMRRLKGTTSGSSPSTPTNSPMGSPTILKRMMTAIRRRSETVLTFHPDQFTDGEPKSPQKQMQRSVSSPEFLEGSPEGDMLKHYSSLKSSNVPVIGLDRTKAARISRRESQKRADWYRQQLQKTRTARNDKTLAKRALQQSLMDRKDELQRIEAFFKASIDHKNLQEWKSQNEHIVTHTIDRLNRKQPNDSPQTRDSSSEGASESASAGDVSIEGTPAEALSSVEGLEQISGMARSSLVLSPGRPRAESECSETSI